MADFESAQQLYVQTRRAALAGLSVTLALGVAKLLGGWLGNSLALLSDSVHSFGDAFSSLSILLALWWAEKPADREHPYGHTRIESIAASNVALLLIGSGLWVGISAIRTWSQPTAPTHWFALAIALISVVLNEIVFRYSMRIAKRTGSKAVEASAWDQRLDVFGSFIVLLSLAIGLFASAEWRIVDHVAALIVAAIILWAGGSLFWSSLQDLMDRQADPQMLNRVRELALEVDGVRDIEKLLIRKAGLEYFVDIHVEVDPQITVLTAHEIGHGVKNRLIGTFPAVRDVLVHIEPHRA
ncbi:MAG TPA: cation diffusion facilitator family transporter [Pirellulales bacterium]|jgi:cation diffusion facilitator family transporter|nr:cation diffusion facilitator family transporter [Pirellulales bacterium]